jgi:hypothetical protein
MKTTKINAAAAGIGWRKSKPCTKPAILIRELENGSA